jgi:hypothetical protein
MALRKTTISLDSSACFNDLNLDWPGPVAACTWEYARSDRVEVNLGQVHYVSAFGTNMDANPSFFCAHTRQSIQMLQSVSQLLQMDALLPIGIQKSPVSCRLRRLGKPLIGLTERVVAFRNALQTRVQNHK